MNNLLKKKKKKKSMNINYLLSGRKVSEQSYGKKYD